MESKVLSPPSEVAVTETAARESVPGTHPFEFVGEKAGIREWRLASNGLPVLLLRSTVAPVATFAVVYHVGSRNEAVGYTGATHLLEHLMFKGTAEYDRENGTAVAAVLEAIGARFNATTWFDRTNYYETVPSDALEVAVKIEASRMRGALLRDSDRVPEMTVVRNEYERGKTRRSRSFTRRRSPRRSASTRTTTRRSAGGRTSKALRRSG